MDVFICVMLAWLWTKREAAVGGLAGTPAFDTCCMGVARGAAAAEAAGEATGVLRRGVAVGEAAGLGEGETSSPLGMLDTDGVGAELADGFGVLLAWGFGSAAGAASFWTEAGTPKTEVLGDEESENVAIGTGTTGEDPEPWVACS